MPQLTRDQRLTCIVLRNENLSHLAIAARLGITEYQVRYAIKQGHPTPQKKTRRRPKLNDDEVEQLVAFVTASRDNRRMPWTKVAELMGWGYDCVRTALKREGFIRRLAMRKLPITVTNAAKRLAFAEAHKDWTREDWNRVLWTYETWATGGRHTRTYVTRRPGEVWEDDCIVEKPQTPHGWMFWACFSGAAGKGPGILWEKDWAKINKHSYMDKIVPIIDGWITLCEQEGKGEHILMQDNAPGHAARDTQTDLRERGLVVMDWPPFSPDLNPIERVWFIMKHQLQEEFPERMTPLRLREAVAQTWDDLSFGELSDLLDTMPARMQAVIDAGGYHTPF